MLDIKLGDYNKETGKREKRKINFKGNSITLLQDAYDVTCILLADFLFRKLDLDKNSKFEILDSFLDSVKKTLEQDICMGVE